MRHVGAPSACWPRWPVPVQDEAGKVCWKSLKNIRLLGVQGFAFQGSKRSFSEARSHERSVLGDPKGIPGPLGVSSFPEK